MTIYQSNTFYQVPDSEIWPGQLLLVVTPLSQGKSFDVIKVTQDGGPKERRYDVLGRFWDINLAYQFYTVMEDSND